MVSKSRLPIHSSDLKKLPPEEVEEILRQMHPSEWDELVHTWEFFARPNQLPPEGNWKIWLALAGRGFGKTRTGVEWVRHKIKSGCRRIACVAPTKGDVRRVMVEGESGFLNVCWKGDKTYKGKELGFPVWSPTNNTLTWANGAKCEFFSAEDPERLRGPQFESAYCDEIAAWTRMVETWDMLQFTLRLGKNPQIFISTTPKPVKLLRNLVHKDNVASGKVVLTTGSSYENADNIDLDALKQYEGTRLGRQELYAEILDEAAGALWTRAILDKCDASHIADPLEFSKELSRIVVSVDPAVSANEESDLTGIIVAGIDINGKAYVLEDATGMYLPEQWGTKVVELYYKYSADRIVAERNQGGDMVKHTIKVVDETVPIRMVHASRGKFARAEPVSALYERGMVFHCRDLNDLEQQMVTWEPLGAIGSPDRLDALVWAITDLLLKGRAQAPLQLTYKPLIGILN